MGDQPKESSTPIPPTEEQPSEPVEKQTGRQGRYAPKFDLTGLAQIEPAIDTPRARPASLEPRAVIEPKKSPTLSPAELTKSAANTARMSRFDTVVRSHTTLPDQEGLSQSSIIHQRFDQLERNIAARMDDLFVQSEVRFKEQQSQLTEALYRTSKLESWHQTHNQALKRHSQSIRKVEDSTAKIDDIETRVNSLSDIDEKLERSSEEIKRASIHADTAHEKKIEEQLAALKSEFLRNQEEQKTQIKADQDTFKSEIRSQLRSYNETTKKLVDEFKTETVNALQQIKDDQSKAYEGLLVQLSGLVTDVRKGINRPWVRLIIIVGVVLCGAITQCYDRHVTDDRKPMVVQPAPLQQSLPSPK